MENTVKAEKLLQEMDKKLENEVNLCWIEVFYHCLNKRCIKGLEHFKRGRTTHGGYFKEKIAFYKKRNLLYKDQIYLLRLDLQIESETDEIKYKIIRRYAWIFYDEVFEKICTFEFSKNDFITEKWIKELCEKFVYLSDFYAQKAERMFKIREIKKSKKENYNKLPEEL